jgi:hypothetical protein
MSVNETATQNRPATPFSAAWVEGGAVGQIGQTEEVRIATLLEFDENGKFLTTPCAHI